MSDAQYQNPPVVGPSQSAPPGFALGMAFHGMEYPLASWGSALWAALLAPWAPPQGKLHSLSQF